MNFIAITNHGIRKKQLNKLSDKILLFYAFLKLCVFIKVIWIVVIVQNSILLWIVYDLSNLVLKSQVLGSLTKTT